MVSGITVSSLNGNNINSHMHVEFHTSAGFILAQSTNMHGIHTALTWSFILSKNPFHMKGAPYWVKTHALQNHRMTSDSKIRQNDEWLVDKNCACFASFRRPADWLHLEKEICRHVHDTDESVHTRKTLILSCKMDEFRLLHWTLYHLVWRYVPVSCAIRGNCNKLPASQWSQGH